MAPIPVPQVAAADPPERDRGRKLLGLLEYATNASGAEELADTLGVLMLSLMGEFTSTGGAVLVRDGDQRLRLLAARGSVQARAERLPDEIGDGDDVALRSSLGLELVVPMVHHDCTLGYLGLAKRVVGAYRNDDRELVRLVAGIAATSIRNQQLHAELRTVNRTLERRVFDLHTVFDLSSELNGSNEPEGIFRVVGQTVMAHLLVSRCVVLMDEDGRARIRFNRGVRLDEDDHSRIQRLDFPRVASDDQDGLATLSMALAQVGIDELIPLCGGETVRGYLGVGGHQNRRALERDETTFLQTLGQQAIAALDNLNLHVDRARRQQLERDLVIARQIQRALLPASLPSVDGYQLAVHSQPCFEVGGDYYDVLRLKGGVLIAIGDVSGKSVPAALLMSVVQATIRSLAGRPGETPSTLIDALNRHLVESTQPTKFVSFFLGWLDPGSGRLEYTNAGHNAPLLVRHDGTLEKLNIGGPVLGILDDATFEETAVDLAPGDLLYLYTDGVTEAMDCAENEFGDERLERLLRNERHADATTILRRVTEAVLEHSTGVEPADDVTAMAIRRLEA